MEVEGLERDEIVDEVEVEADIVLGGGWEISGVLDWIGDGVCEESLSFWEDGWWW